MCNPGVYHTQDNPTQISRLLSWADSWGRRPQSKAVALSLDKNLTGQEKFRCRWLGGRVV